MPDLSSLNESLERLKGEVLELRQSATATRVRPHKLVMLLAVLDLAEDGLLDENKVFFDSALSKYFRRRFAEIALDNDSCRPGAPFFHLRSSDFWRHKVKSGHESEYSKVTKYEGSASLDAIEYAVLEDWAFDVVKSPHYREQLRHLIMEVIATNNQIDDRLSLSFHRGFSLSRSGVSSVLQSAVAGEDVSAKNVKENTTLGTVQVEAMPRYAERCGLLDSSKRPTIFGELAAEKDPTLSHPATQWVMHYFISAPHRYTPNFWNALFSSSFSSNESFSANDISMRLSEFAVQQSGKEPSERTLSNTANAFVGTYSKADALGQLEILENVDSKYFVRQPKPLPVGAFACILADYWAGVWGERGDVLLREVNEGPLSSLLLLSSGEVNDLLGELSERGLVVRQRRVPPFKVSRNWSDGEALWREQLYS